MQVIEEGFVLELDGDLAKVKLAANANCGNCNSCDVVHLEILADNSLNAAPGQKVKLTMERNSMIKVSFMLFLFPLLSIFTGLYAGSQLSFYFLFNETAAMLIGALVFLSIAIAFIYFYDKRYRLNKSNFPQIIEVIK